MGFRFGPAAFGPHLRGALLATFAVLALLAPCAAVAQTRDADALVIGGDAGYPPFHFKDESGQAAGFDVALARAIAADQGLRVRFELGDWDSTLQRLERGELDAVPMFFSAERAERFLFTEPVLMRYHAVFGHRSRPGILSLEELAGARVAVQRSGLAWDALRSVEGVTCIAVDTEAAALSVVAGGAADYALVPTGIGHRAINVGGLVDIVALSPPLMERRYAFAVRRDRPDLVARLDVGLEHLRISGEQDRLYVEWIGNLGVGQRATGPLLPRWVWLLPLLLVPAAWLWLRSAAAKRSAAESPRDRPSATVDLANDDGALEGMPDRRELLAQLEQRIAAWHPGRSGFALAKIHLQGLDVIEDIAGENAHRDVQRAIAGRLVDLYGTGHVALLGAGSLAVVLPGIADRTGAEQAMQSLTSLLVRRVELGQLPVELRSRIGIAVFPGDGADAKNVARAARIACEAAQKRGMPGLCYDPRLEPDPRNLTLLMELREAIADGTLGFALQPKLDLRSGRWTGAELLVRWNHPRHGPLSPAAFVPLAEQAGVIGEMTLYLVRCGLERCRQWLGGSHALSLAINVSANDLADPALVQAIIDTGGTCAPCLILEVTETDVMRDPDLVVEAIGRLRHHGIRISVDDFGTGHSSLTNLRRLAPDELKIDQSFVFTLLQSPSDQAIVRATIRLAHDLGASVTAEGIEDEATLAWLVDAGCDAAQGFGIARPMEPAQFAQSLQAKCA